MQSLREAWCEPELHHVAKAWRGQRCGSALLLVTLGLSHRLHFWKSGCSPCEDRWHVGTQGLAHVTCASRRTQNTQTVTPLLVESARVSRRGKGIVRAVAVRHRSPPRNPTSPPPEKWQVSTWRHSWSFQILSTPNSTELHCLIDEWFGSQTETELLPVGVLIRTLWVIASDYSQQQPNSIMKLQAYIWSWLQARYALRCEFDLYPTWHLLSKWQSLCFYLCMSYRTLQENMTYGKLTAKRSFLPSFVVDLHSYNAIHQELRIRSMYCVRIWIGAVRHVTWGESCPTNLHVDPNWHHHPQLGHPDGGVKDRPTLTAVRKNDRWLHILMVCCGYACDPIIHDLTLIWALQWILLLDNGSWKPLDTCNRKK